MSILVDKDNSRQDTNLGYCRLLFPDIYLYRAAAFLSASIFYIFVLMYRLCICCVAFLFYGLFAYAQSADSLVAEGVRLEMDMKETQALQKYQSALRLDSSDVTALWHASMLSTRQGIRASSTKARQRYFDQGAALARKALGKAPANKEANVALALALRQLSFSAGAKEKAGFIKEIKSCADKALMSDSTYGMAWFVLGNWNYDVSSLNFAERAATKLLFGGFPPASLDQAIADYERCQHFDPHFIENVYQLAKVYHAKGKDLKAIATLKQALHLRPIREGDRQIQDDCRTMLQSLQ